MLTPGEYVVPRNLVSANGGPVGVQNALSGGRGVTINLHITGTVVDGPGIERLVENGLFQRALARRLPVMFTDNPEGVRTNSRRALGVTG
jgi:hypothetical protein